MRYLFKHIIKTVFIVSLAILVASCSFKTFYNQLDNFIPYYVEGMVSLDSMLEEKVSERTLVFINWHRDTQLNQYADWFGEIQRDTNEQLSDEKVHQHIVMFYHFLNSVLLKFDEEMALLLPLINAEQREELFCSFDEKNDEFREERIELNVEERITKYTDRIIDGYKTWIGDLTNEQEVFAKLAATKLQSTGRYRFAQRIKWQQSIKRILDTNNAASQKTTSLHRFFKDYRSEDALEMNKVANMNKNIISYLTRQVVSSMTDKQKMHFVTRTNDYIRMFRELAEQR